MKKDFETRFMPNVKFLLPKQSDARTWLKLLEITKLESFDNYIGFCTNAFGDSIYNGFEDIELFNNYKSVHKEVSIFEAIPELIPDDMRYNKELDKLVPDVVGYLSNDIIYLVDEFQKNKDFKTKTYGDIKKEVLQRENIDIKEDDKQILDELKKSGKSYLEIINVIKNTDTFKKHNGGDGNDYYDLPLNALQLQDLIEFKNMNANIKDIFKACWRKGDKKGVDEIYDVEKMVYYSLREAGKVLNTKDYISIATRIMGKQNVK